VAERTPDREWCTSCLRWLRHDQRYCPLFPDVDPPKGFCESNVRKWSRCLCKIHTCFDARTEGIERSPEDAPEYKDFV